MVGRPFRMWFHRDRKGTAIRSHQVNGNRTRNQFGSWSKVQSLMRSQKRIYPAPKRRAVTCSEPDPLRLLAR
jgi:hypothetical protein